MNTNIYNGNIINNLDFIDFFHKLQKSKHGVENILNINFLKDTFSLFFYLYDKQNVLGHIENHIDNNFNLLNKNDFPLNNQIEENRINCLNLLNMYIDKTLKNKHKYSLYYNDLVFSLSIFPLNKNKILLLDYGNDECFEFIKTIIPEIKKYDLYSNFNNNNLSKEEWFEREKNWKEVLLNNDSNIFNSLIFSINFKEFSNINTIFKIIENFKINDNNFNIKNYYPTLEERKENLRNYMFKKVLTNTFVNHNNENNINHKNYLNGYLNEEEYNKIFNNFFDKNKNLKDFEEKIINNVINDNLIPNFDFNLNNINNLYFNII